MDITRICAMQRAYFEKGETKNVGFRIAQLKKLQVAIRAQEKLLLDALQADLGKSGFEGYMSEVGMVLEELAYMLRHVRRFARAKAVPTPLAQGIAASRVLAKPYGNVLIMSPWNYPLLLTIGPLVDALAALPLTRHIYASDANFVLVEVSDANGIYAYLRDRGIIVRNRNRIEKCLGCLRITVGTEQENETLIKALAEYGK